jgi:hypothetical protein
MMVDGLTLCTMPGGWQTRFKASYPRMPHVDIEGANSAAQALYDGIDCDAMIAPKNNYDGWRTDSKYCGFDVAETVFVDIGGKRASSGDSNRALQARMGARLVRVL